MINHKGYITEIFHSVQGEGMHCGEEQLFIRFFGCNMSCEWCDTRQNQSSKSICEILFPSGKVNVHSPLTIEKCIEYIEIFLPKVKFEYVSITGGEPLLQKNFAGDLACSIRNLRKKVYLETNGINYKELDSLVDDIDCIACDFKLPSSTGMGEFWSQHTEFLKIARKTDVFVKIVVNNKTTARDVKKAVETMKSIDKNIPLVIQPASGGFIEPAYNTLASFKRFAEALLDRVYVVPQIHKIIGIK